MSETTISGRIYKFGDNVNSDIIIAGRYLIYIEPEDLAKHAFEMLGEGFPAKLREYDILVAGRNFGCGSAREQASTAIKGLGIKAVVAASFAWIGSWLGALGSAGAGSGSGGAPLA